MDTQGGTFYIAEESDSRTAFWSRNIGAFSLLFFIVATLFHRFGLAQSPDFLLAIKIAFGLAVLAVLFAVRALVLIWRQGKHGFRDSLFGIFYALPLLLLPVYTVMEAKKYPVLNDVMTETTTPPTFAFAQKMRPAWAQAVSGENVKPAPLARPLFTDVPMIEVFGIVRNLMQARRWEILGEVLPQDKKPTSASIEATATTSLLAFRDDVIVRLSADGKKTRVDMRSTSRIGKSDMGANLARIDEFLIKLRQKLNER